MDILEDLEQRLKDLARGRASPEAVRQWICANFIPAPDVDIPDLPDIEPVDLDFGMGDDEV